MFFLSFFFIFICLFTDLQNTYTWMCGAWTHLFWWLLAYHVKPYTWKMMINSFSPNQSKYTEHQTANTVTCKPSMLVFYRVARISAFFFIFKLTLLRIYQTSVQSYQNYRKQSFIASNLLTLYVCSHAFSLPCTLKSLKQKIIKSKCCTK